MTHVKTTSVKTDTKSDIAQHGKQINAAQAQLPHLLIMLL